MMKKVLPVLALVLIALGVPSCSTNTQGDDASPVYLEVGSNDSLAVNVATLSLVQVPSITVQSKLKNPSAGSSSFLDVRIEDYTVEWRRTDGGKTVPQTETFGGAQILPVGGSVNFTDYPIMTATGIQRSPLDKLFPFNGGIDPETGKTEIRTIAIVTFHGHTMSGQPVSGSGNLQVYFFYAPLARKASSK